MRPKATVLTATIFILMFSICVMAPGMAVGAEGTISVDTNDIDIRALLSSMAKANGINLVIGDSVKGKVSISLSGVSAMEAMELILISNGFVLEQVGNSVIAGKPEEIVKFLPRLSKIIAIQHASATELATTLTGVVSGDVDIKVDTRTNSMIITGPQAGIQALEQLVKLLDVELPEEPVSPMVTKVLPLTYTQASAIQTVISDLTSSGGKVSIDDGTNSIVITDEPTNAERLSEIVSQLDTETPYLLQQKAQREKAQEAARPLPPPELRTKLFNLNHIDANAIKGTLQEMLSPLGRIQTFVRQTEPLAPMGTSLAGSFGGRSGSSFGGGSGVSTSGTTASAEGEKWSDLLIVTDVAEALEDIGKLIEELDKEALQVKIEARVVEINLTEAMDLGINWEAMHSPSGSTIEADFPVAIANGMTVNLGTFSEGSFEDITGRLQALETLGKANIMFSPSVMTLDNEMAQMRVADRIPIARTFETEFRSTTGFEYLNVGISLSVIPHISEDGYIIMDATPQIDSITGWTTGVGGSRQPIISSRMSHTRVRVKDGETFAIGGLIKDEQTESKSGIPILGRIPLLGRLFGSKNNTSTKTDLIVFITPTIYKDSL
ncbi:secretin N-terminal domain-containing protein [Candidatus Poribacteria bacterium]